MSAVPDAIRIVTVDDHLLFREGLGAVLETQPDMNLVAQAPNGREAMVAIRSATQNIQWRRAQADWRAIQGNGFCSEKTGDKESGARVSLNSPGPVLFSVSLPNPISLKSGRSK